MNPFFNPQDVLVFGAELFVVALALVLFAVDLILPADRRRAVPLLALAGIAGAVAIALTLPVVEGGWSGYFARDAATVAYDGFGGLLRADAYSQFFKVVFLLAAFLTTLASMRFLEREGVASREFYPFILLSTAGAMVLVSARELITAWVALETMVLPLYVLTGYFKHDRRSGEAAFKYFVLAAFSSALFVYGASLMYGVTGSTAFDGVARALAAPETLASMGTVFVFGLVLLAAALAFEITLVPFHAWAPDTYEGAPTPVTAFLAVGPKLAAVAVMARLFLEAFGAQTQAWLPLLAAMSALTMTVGNVAAVRQESAKRMLAYSSVAHAGYMMLGLVAFTRLGLASVLFYGLAYLFMNMGAFFTLLLLRRKGVACENIEDFAGLARREPWHAAAMLIFLLSLTGIPITAGFVGKFFLFGAALEQGWVWLLVVAALNTVVSLYYYMRVVVHMYLREPKDGEAADIEAPLALRVALLLALFGTFGIGVYSAPFWNFALNCATLLR